MYKYLKVKAKKKCSSVVPELRWGAGQVRTLPQSEANKLLATKDFTLVKERN